MFWYLQILLSSCLSSLFLFIPNKVHLHKGVLYVFHGEYEKPGDLRWQLPALRRLLGEALFLEDELLASTIAVSPGFLTKNCTL